MMTPLHATVRRLLWVALFAVAFAFVETSVVVYLRALYYPQGLSFPLKVILADHLAIELMRETSTILMLAAVAAIATRRPWDRFGFFMVVFGVWDVFFYIWLKVTLNWPLSVFDWDILFLIPTPWIGPVIAPVAISLLMIAFGSSIVLRNAQEQPFRPGWLSWLLAVIATAAVLYSFMYDTAATLHGSEPQRYPYELLALSVALYITAFAFACKTPHPRRSHHD